MPNQPTRFVSRLTTNAVAIILAGGRGSRLGVLTDWRTKPAVPFGGKFRIIDFTLSNCVNSGIRKICVPTQYKSHSLIQHILQGWNGLNLSHGEFIDLLPAQQWVDEESWYQGTADAVYQNLDIIESHGMEHVLILAGDHVYNMDYGEMLGAHVESGVDFTIACIPVPVESASGLGVMQVDETGRILAFDEKPANPKAMPGKPDTALGSMGIYAFSLDYMSRVLREDAEDGGSDHDFGKNIIPKALARGDTLQAYEFRNPAPGREPYWRDVGTIDAYYQANMEIISPQPPLDIYDVEWPIMTYHPQLPPAHFVSRGRSCEVVNSIVSGGCVISCSKLENTLLYSNVKVHDRCTLEGVLALPGCEIGAGSRLKNVVLDNGCQVPDGSVIGHDPESDAKRFDVSEGGIVVVNREMLGQGSHYMPGVVQDS